MAVVQLTPQGGGWVDDDIAGNANISATKVIARRSLDVELFGPSTTVANLTKWLHVVRGTQGTIVGAEAAIATVATGADRTITVDVQKSTGAGAFATVMSSTIDITDGTAIRTPVTGVFSDTTLTDDDILQVVVTVAGSLGAQAQGLMLTLTFDERAT